MYSVVNGLPLVFSNIICNLRFKFSCTLPLLDLFSFLFDEDEDDEDDDEDDDDDDDWLVVEGRTWVMDDKLDPTDGSVFPEDCARRADNNDADEFIVFPVLFPNLGCISLLDDDDDDDDDVGICVVAKLSATTLLS